MVDRNKLHAYANVQGVVPSLWMFYNIDGVEFSYLLVRTQEPNCKGVLIGEL